MSGSVQNKTGWFINLIKTINTKQLKGHIPSNKPTAGSAVTAPPEGKPICECVGGAGLQTGGEEQKKTMATPQTLTSWETEVKTELTFDVGIRKTTCLFLCSLESKVRKNMMISFFF